MTTFLLSKEAIKIRDGKTAEELAKEPRRVILDEVSHGDQIAVFEAEPVMNGYRLIKSAWCVAREQVDESKFRHVVNQGWFA